MFNEIIHNSIKENKYWNSMNNGENNKVVNQFSLKFFPKGPINSKPALVQIMAWHRTRDKPLADDI